jgi:hypothetical protein
MACPDSKRQRTLKRIFGPAAAKELLLDHEIDLDDLPEGELVKAAKNNDLEAVKCLCKLARDHPRFSFKTADKEAVAVAAASGNITMVKYFCEFALQCPFSGIDPAYASNAAIRWSIGNNDLDTVKVLCQLGKSHPDLRINPLDGHNVALVLCANSGRLDMLRCVYNQVRKNPSWIKTHFELPSDRIVVGAAAYGQADVVAYLCELSIEAPELGIDPASNNNKALQLASKFNHAEVVQVLCDHPTVDPTVLSAEAGPEVRLIAATSLARRERWTELRSGWLAALTSSWK